MKIESESLTFRLVKDNSIGNGKRVFLHFQFSFDPVYRFFDLDRVFDFLIPHKPVCRGPLITKLKNLHLILYW